MKKIATCLFAAFVFWSCEIEALRCNDDLIISGIKADGKTEIVNVSLKSGDIEFTETDCLG